MKERTRIILQALIEEFVSTAQPVASKKLLESRQFPVSSATIRNEFALLEEVGLIASPHISSGKVPTQQGYRFFVDEMMNESAQELSLVQESFEKYVQAYRLEKSKESMFDALRLLAKLSGNVAFSMVENDHTMYIGLSNVLRSPEFQSDPERAVRIVEIFEGRDSFRRMVEQMDIPRGEVKIFIGEENLVEEISSCAMMVIPYESSHSQGVLGILGPMRMKYRYNKTLLENAVGMIV